MQGFNEHTLQFIAAHKNDDVRSLALQAKRYPMVDMTAAVGQIDGWQRAKQKIPSWASHDGIIYPQHLAMEQCSSDATAQYKTLLCKRLIDEYDSNNNDSTLVDLTGGMGVDFAALAPLFCNAIYIEQQHELCRIAKHNFSILGIRGADIVENDSTEAMKTLTHATAIFADPARRDTHGRRTFAIADCTPNILENLKQCLEKTCFMMLKLSPMLDWRQALKELNSACSDAVREIHIVATDNECKELLFVLSKKSSKPAAIFCANDKQIFNTNSETELNAPAPPAVACIEEALNTKWLYEPNAAIMKAGCFHTLTQQFDVRAVAQNSHVFISDKHIPDFPGRIFKVLRATTMNKKMMAETMRGIDKANITTRNFDMTPQQLRKKLKINDGGNIYLIATTTIQRKHIIYVCGK